MNITYSIQIFIEAYVVWNYCLLEIFLIKNMKIKRVYCATQYIDNGPNKD